MKPAFIALLMIISLMIVSFIAILSVMASGPHTDMFDGLFWIVIPLIILTILGRHLLLRGLYGKNHAQKGWCSSIKEIDAATRI